MNGMGLLTKKCLAFDRAVCRGTYGGGEAVLFLLCLTPCKGDAEALTGLAWAMDVHPGPSDGVHRLRSDVLQKLSLPPSVTVMESCRCDW